MEDYWASPKIKKFFKNKNANEYFEHLINNRNIKIPAGNILDAGCGYGRNLMLFANDRYRKYAFDSSLESIQYTANRYGNIKTICSNIQSEPFIGCLFSAIVCDGVLHQLLSLDEFNSAIKYFSKIIICNGILFLSLFINNPPPTGARETEKGIWKTDHGVFMLLQSPESIVEACRTNNFSLLYRHEKIIMLDEGARSNVEFVFIKENIKNA
ncbi:MAG: class I SAM-dependent methyltransferase [Holosporales bacterium]|jgi:SAM-dependent methyltransferase|nr:class I SAM-dependent methyltransferase [Holosporales bacterium]